MIALAWPFVVLVSVILFGGVSMWWLTGQMDRDKAQQLLTETKTKMSDIDTRLTIVENRLKRG